MIDLVAFLFLFFAGFNLLEATLPSLISKTAPADLKGTAMGIYSSSQFLGAFLGGLGGGWIYGQWSISAVFLFCAAMALVWLLVAAYMQPPRHLSSMLLRVGEMEEQQAALMSKRMTEVKGVAEAVVLAVEGVAYLKVDKEKLDQEQLFSLISQAAEASPSTA